MKILSIGNSFAHDTMAYLGEIAKNDITELPEINVMIEFNSLPDTWEQGWTAGSNVLEILGYYFKN